MLQWKGGGRGEVAGQKTNAQGRRRKGDAIDFISPTISTQLKLDGIVGCGGKQANSLILPLFVSDCTSK